MPKVSQSLCVCCEWGARGLGPGAGEGLCPCPIQPGSAASGSTGKPWLWDRNPMA